jgi:hypothetical protein
MGIAATMRGLNALGLQRKSSTIPASTNKLVTKGELNTYYYVDNESAGIISYPNNRIITYDNIRDGIFTKPRPQYYEYDVTRSGIPGATGAFFNYIGTDGGTYTVLQNSYGYVGRFCMEENSYRNNQFQVYSISQVGLCYPTPNAAYPQPYVSGGYLFFNNLGSYQVEDVKIHQIVDAKRIQQDTRDNILAGELIIGGGTAIGTAIGANDDEDIERSIWEIVITFLIMTGTTIFANDGKPTSQLRYDSQGVYSNGSVSMADIKLPSGSNQFYISFKVNGGFGFYAAIFGYGANQLTPPLVLY